MSNIDLLLKYFPELSSHQQNLFAQLPEIYNEWNQKINLISRQDVQDLLEKHVLHSLAIAKFITFKSGQTIIDIGTGGGFPGIPLAIMFPKSKFILVDSIGKKIKVVQDIVQKLNLHNVDTINGRIESISIKPDFYVTRAVAHLHDLQKWIQSNTPLIALKGGDLSNEIKNIKTAELIPISNYFNEDFYTTKFLVTIS